ncbi:hypothetical protein RvY_12887-3 [Ramazzottius varieornatus]|uniref:Uncharacterized protein n=1 Tax=Ramazzottius varieornatus TaxID=947166 RepID=A0A1D1VN02_RAMVA|nr:hypothetical protein RvY_12887-3 [Ramazzottius varieornatus]
MAKYMMHSLLRCIVALLSTALIIIGLMSLTCAVYGRNQFIGGVEFSVAIWIAVLFSGCLSFVGQLSIAFGMTQCFTVSSSAVSTAIACVVRQSEHLHTRQITECRYRSRQIFPAY